MTVKGTEIKDVPEVWFLRGERAEALLPCAAGEHVRELPGELVIAPGVYTEGGNLYNLGPQGLYRFFYPLQKNMQRIVYCDDVEALVSAVCWVHSHGGRDNGKSFEEACSSAMSGKLVMTCGAVRNFLHGLFKSFGLESRLVGSRTLVGKNGYDDGHSTIEIHVDGRWVLCDPDQHCFFSRGGTRLSLLDAVLSVREGEYSLERLSSSAPLAVSDFKGEEGYDYGLPMETKIHSEETLRAWYSRIMQIPIIYEEGKAFCTGNSKDMPAIRQIWPDLESVRMDEFRRRFYGRDRKGGMSG